VIINKEYQSIILLEDDITKRVLTIVFDHQPHKIQDAFLVKIIAFLGSGDENKLLRKELLKYQTQK